MKGLRPSSRVAIDYQNISALPKASLSAYLQKELLSAMDTGFQNAPAFDPLSNAHEEELLNDVYEEEHRVSDSFGSLEDSFIFEKNESGSSIQNRLYETTSQNDLDLWRSREVRRVSIVQEIANSSISIYTRGKASEGKARRVKMLVQ